MRNDVEKDKQAGDIDLGRYDNQAETHAYLDTLETIDADDVDDADDMPRNPAGAAAEGAWHVSSSCITTQVHTSYTLTF